MKNQHTTTAPAETAGLAVSDSLLHVSHLIDEWCDVNMPRIYKESDVVLQPNDWYEYTKEEWATLESLMLEASSDWKEGF